MCKYKYYSPQFPTLFHFFSKKLSTPLLITSQPTDLQQKEKLLRSGANFAITPNCQLDFTITTFFLANPVFAEHE
jgi:hypothetical protein